MKHIGFGDNKRQDNIWAEYLGKWVVIRVPGIQPSYAGKMIDIKAGEYAVLSPFQDGHFDVKQGFIHEMSNERTIVPLVGSPIEPTTQENIENYCKYQNKKSLEELTKKRVKKKSDKWN